MRNKPKQASLGEIRKFWHLSKDDESSSASPIHWVLKWVLLGHFFGNEIKEYKLDLVQSLIFLVSGASYKDLYEASFETVVSKYFSTVVLVTDKKPHK